MADMAFTWERLAMDGAEMPEGLSLEEQLAFQAMAHLYARFNMKVIDRERGHIEKGRVKHALECRQRNADMSRRLTEKHVKLLKDLEGAACEYAKTRTLEEADRMYQVVYGMLPGGKV